MAKEKTRICDRCGSEKNIQEYQRKKGSRGGYLNICRECERDRLRKYYIRYSEHYFNARYSSILYRAKQYGIPSDLTYEEFLDIIVADDPKSKTCVYCGKTEKQELEDIGRSLALDHVLPLHLTCNTKWNIVNCCAECNSLKRHKHILEFHRENDFFTEERLFNVINQMAEDAGFHFVVFYSFIEALEEGLEGLKENHRRLEELRKQADKPQLKAVI